MSNLDNIRLEIDRVNNEILELLKERFELVKQVGDYKKKHNLDIYVKSREDKILKKLSDGRDNIPKESVEKIFLTIMEESRNFEK